MIPEFKFKRKTAFQKKSDIKKIIKEAVSQKKVRVAAAAAAGVVVVGAGALAFGGKDVEKKTTVYTLMQTAGVTTQMKEVEVVQGSQASHAPAMLSKMEDAAKTSLGMNEAEFWASDEGADDQIQEVSVQTVGQASQQVAGPVSQQAVQPQRPVYEGFSNPGIAANVENYVNIRLEKSETAKVCGKLGKNQACEILSVEDGWYGVVTNGVYGYVKAEYLVTSDAAWELAEQLKIAYARVNTDTLYVREQPSESAAVLGMVALDQKLNIVETADGWLKIWSEADSLIGYVKQDYVTIEYTLPRGEAIVQEEPEEKEEKTSSKNKKSDKSEGKKGSKSTKPAKDCSSVVDYAMQFVGNPYVYGGTSLTKGADCSGFTMSVYAKFGVALPHSSSAQARCGSKVSSGDVQPGDLMFYGSGGGINHVAMYIGGGKIVHASTERTGIKVSNAYYRTPVTIRRVR